MKNTKSEILSSKQIQNLNFSMFKTKRFKNLNLNHLSLFRVSYLGFRIFVFSLLAAGCTVKAVGDPNRPITINANVIIDIRGLKQTANGIEDMVAQGGKS